MRKKIKWFCLTTILTIALAGCGGMKKETKDLLIPIEEAQESLVPETVATTTEEAVTENINREELQSDQYEREVLEKVEDAGTVSNKAEYTKELLEEHQNNPKKYYAYSVLEPDFHLLYLEIYSILQNRQEDIDVSSVDSQLIDKVFQYVLTDHPEIFYVKGYTYTKFTKDKVVTRISFSGTYSMGEEQIAESQKGIDQYAANCLAGISAGADEYSKVKYVYEYLINNTEYNLSAQENQNICSVFLSGQSVCQGYAKAMQYLLNQLDVFCTLTIGTVDNGEGHAWNLVSMEGAYYYVDATWGDAFYKFDGENYEDQTENIPSINYDYLGVTTEQLRQTHQIGGVVPMPRCVSMEANYYRKENAYFTQLDDQKVKSLFERSSQKGLNYVTMKCSSNEIYQSIMEDMITNQKVFQYLGSGKTSVAYTSNDAQLTITFWLS